MELSWDFSQKDFQIVTKYVGVYETNHRLAWPGPVSVSRFSLFISEHGIVLISANEVNLCQDLTNYLLLGPGCAG